MTARIRVFVNEPARSGTIQVKRSGAVIASYASSGGSRSDVLSDTTFSNWRKRIAHGEILIGGFSRQKELVSCGGGSYRYWNTYGDPYTTDVIGAQDASVNVWLAANYGGNIPKYQAIVIPYDRMSTEAKVKCLANVDSTPANVMEDLAEYKSTIGSLKEAAKALDSTNDYLAGRIRRYRKSGQTPEEAAARAWLEGNFGYYQIYRSARDALSALNKPRKLPPRLKAVGFSTDAQSATYASSLSPTGFSISWNTIQSTSAKTCAYTFYKVLEPTRNIRGNLGIRGKAVPYTVWATMPYSWAVDYFVDISGRIAGLTNLVDPNVVFLGGAIAVSADRTYIRDVTGMRNDNMGYSLNIDQYYTLTSGKTRSAWMPSVGDLQIDLSQDGLGAVQAVNLWAAAVSRLGSILRGH